MNPLQTKVFNEALRNLNALKAKYKIVLEDGSEYGDLVLAPPERPKVKRSTPGTFSVFYRPYVEHLEVGDTVEVPGRGDPEAMRSAMSGWLTAHYGQGNVKTKVEAGVDVVYVMRVS